MVQYMEHANGERSLSELYEACARDDTTAIAEFVRLYQPELAAYARRRNADDPEGAADLATFDTVRRLADMRSLEEPAIRAYLYRCLKSRMIDENRRSHLHQVSLDDLPDELTTDGPEAPVLGQLGLDEMLDLLTPAEREVVSHRFVAGYTSVETAERVGRSPDAVRRLQSNALARLRLALAVAVVMAAIGAAAWFVATTPVVRNTEPIGDPAQEPEADEDSLPADPGSGASGPSLTTPAAAGIPLPVSTSTPIVTEAQADDPATGSPPAAGATEEPLDPEDDGAAGAVLPAVGTGGVPVTQIATPATSPTTTGQLVTPRQTTRATTIPPTVPPTTAPATTSPGETTPGPSTASTVGDDSPSTTSASTTTSRPGTEPPDSSTPDTTTAPRDSTTTSSQSTTTEPTTNPGQGRGTGQGQGPGQGQGAGQGQGPGPGGPPTDDGRAGPSSRPSTDDRGPDQHPGQGNGAGQNNGSFRGN